MAGLKLETPAAALNARGMQCAAPAETRACCPQGAAHLQLAATHAQRGSLQPATATHAPAMQLHRCGAQRRSAGGMHHQLPGIYRKRAARIELPGESLRAAAAFDEMQRPQHRAMKMMFPCCINTQRVGSRLQVRGKAGGVAQRPGALLQPPAVQISRGADVIRSIQPADAATATHAQRADEIRTVRGAVPRHIQHHAAAQAG